MYDRGVTMSCGYGGFYLNSMACFCSLLFWIICCFLASLHVPIVPQENLIEFWRKTSLCFSLFFFFEFSWFSLFEWIFSETSYHHHHHHICVDSQYSQPLLEYPRFRLLEPRPSTFCSETACCYARSQ